MTLAAPTVASALRVSRAPVLAFCAVGLMWGAFAAAAPAIKARAGVDDGTFGLMLLGTALGLATTLWAAPRWDRRLGPRAMPAGTLVLALMAIVVGQAGPPLALFLALTLAGAASGLTDVVMNARVSELEAREGRSLMNVNHAMFSVAYAASALLTGALREAGWGPEAIFLVVAGLVALTAPGQAMPVDRAPGGGGAPAVLPLGVVGMCGGIVLVAFMAEATVESWSALHIERTLMGGAAEGALGPATLGVTMALGRFGGQAVAARLSEVAVIRAATGLAAAGALVAAFAPTPAVAYLGFGLLGLGISVIGPMGLALAGRLSPPRQRTAVIARVAIIGFLGFFLAPALMGFGAQTVGLRWAFASVALLVSAEWLLVAAVRRHSPP